MAETNTGARALHDLGLAAWFGGSLMGAVGLNGAAAAVKDPTERNPVAVAGWARWAPVSFGAIAAHLAGGAVILAANKGRVATQKGVGSSTTTKMALTGAALAATAYSGVLGSQLGKAGAVPVKGATEPSGGTPADAAKAQSRLRLVQWAIPALTGAVLVVNAQMGEQQRPTSVIGGVTDRFTS